MAFRWRNRIFEKMDPLERCFNIQGDEKNYKYSLYIPENV